MSTATANSVHAKLIGGESRTRALEPAGAPAPTVAAFRRVRGRRRAHHRRRQRLDRAAAAIATSTASTSSTAAPTSASGPAPTSGSGRFLDDADDGEYVAVAPHDALPAPDCLARIVAALEERPEAGLACADYGDGVTPVVDPYFGGIPAPATVDEGWEPAGYPHGTLLVARRDCLGTSDCSTSATSATARRPTSACGPGPPGGTSASCAGAMVRNPELHGALPAVSYLQLRNTLLLVREHSGCYHAGIRFQLALLQLGLGLVCPSRRDPYWHVEGKVRGMVDFARGRFGPPPADLLTRR